MWRLFFALVVEIIVGLLILFQLLRLRSMAFFATDKVKVVDKQSFQDSELFYTSSFSNDNRYPSSFSDMRLVHKYNNNPNTILTQSVDGYIENTFDAIRLWKNVFYHNQFSF